MVINEPTGKTKFAIEYPYRVSNEPISGKNVREISWQSFYFSSSRYLGHPDTYPEENSRSNHGFFGYNLISYIFFFLLGGHGLFRSYSII